MIELESERLRIRELRANDLARVLPVHASNADFLALTEGPAGEVGLYDLERFQRDWQIGQLMEGRHMLGAYARECDEEAIGFADYLEEHEDGLPWLGALIIARAYQRQGYGGELYRRLERHFREDYGWSFIRAAVLAPKLAAEQQAQIPVLLARGPEAYGFRGQVWTCKRAAEVLRRTFGVTYHPAHVNRLLHAQRQSVQRPTARATQRDEAAIAAWCRTLAGPGKKAAEEGPTIVWVDQSGFYLLPLAVRTWAPRRQSPVLRAPLTHDHLSAMGGLTPDGRLFWQMQDRAYRSPDVVRFLRLLLRTIAGKLLVIWDGAPIHRGQPIKAFLARGRPSACTWNPCPATRPSSTPSKGSGTISSPWNSAISAVPICPPCGWRSGAPRNACGTSGLFCKPASRSVAIMFSPSYKRQ